jgi:hypothetical protein
MPSLMYEQLSSKLGSVRGQIKKYGTENLYTENIIFPRKEHLLHLDEMMSDIVVFSIEVAKRKTCGKENVDYRSGK